MKKIAIMLIWALPFVAFAQKEIKPSVANADKALRANKLDEAKNIIDATTTNQTFMVDKKGGPSKNAAKAWFLKGVIYSAIDTTKEQKYKALIADGFPVAKESFLKAKEIDGDKTAAFLNDQSGFPMINENVMRSFASSYYNSAVSAYQDEKNPKKALEFAERTIFFIPNDTSILLNTGVFFAAGAGEIDKAISYVEEYFQKGGKSIEGYQSMIDFYLNNKKDLDKAYTYVQKGKQAYPNAQEFKQYELNILINQSKFSEAKAILEESVRQNPNSKENIYLLGRLQQELGESDNAKASYKAALSIDSKYFDAAAQLADLYWKDAKVIKDQMNKLGNTKEDRAKMLELDKAYVDKLKVALPYVESCEKISPDEVGVLYSLMTIYSDLDMASQTERIKKRLKALGEEVD